ncbi:MAG TPA: AI-2E family transporter [Thermomicrobiales bacterium]|nr:AI-2E family transporter [Thermomicrobiales bacterium]
MSRPDAREGAKRDAERPETPPPVEPRVVEETIEALDRADPRAAEARVKEEEEIFPAFDPEDRTARPMEPVRPFLGQPDEESDDEKLTMRIEVPMRTIVKVVATLVAIWLILQVLSIFLLLLLAVLVCLALLPPVRRLENRGMPRVLAAGTVYLGMLAVLAGFLWLIVPPLVDQTQNLIDNAPQYVENFDDVLDRYPTVRDRVDEYLGIADEEQSALEEAGGAQTESQEAAPPVVDAETVTVGATRVISVGASIVGGLTNVFFVAVLSFYLLIEGDRTWRYFARYMTPTLRYRFHRLGPALTNVVSGYVIGQAIISSIFGVFSYVVLRVLDVPQPLLLAIGGAIAVAIPIVGVPVATIAAMALALSVSWETSLIVLAVFLVYQQFENYVLLPRVYGNTLQVTSLSILVGVLVGGQLLGILGIILSLPLTASIPVIERVWREVVPQEIEALERGVVEGPARPEEGSMPRE